MNGQRLSKVLIDLMQKKDSRKTLIEFITMSNDSQNKLSTLIEEQDLQELLNLISQEKRKEKLLHIISMAAIGRLDIKHIENMLKGLIKNQKNLSPDLNQNEIQNSNSLSRLFIDNKDFTYTSLPENIQKHLALYKEAVDGTDIHTYDTSNNQQFDANFQEKIKGETLAKWMSGLNELAYDYLFEPTTKENKENKAALRHWIIEAIGEENLNALYKNLGEDKTKLIIWQGFVSAAIQSFVATNFSVTNNGEVDESKIAENRKYGLFGLSLTTKYESSLEDLHYLEQEEIILSQDYIQKQTPIKSINSQSFSEDYERFLIKKNIPTLDSKEQDLYNKLVGLIHDPEAQKTLINFLQQVPKDLINLVPVDRKEKADNLLLFLQQVPKELKKLIPEDYLLTKLFKLLGYEDLFSEIKVLVENPELSEEQKQKLSDLIKEAFIRNAFIESESFLMLLRDFKTKNCAFTSTGFDNADVYSRIYEREHTPLNILVELPKNPKDLAAYKGSYILIAKQGLTTPDENVELYYITRDRTHEAVRITINDSKIFFEKLSEIKKDQPINFVELTEAQIDSLITSNGGKNYRLDLSDHAEAKILYSSLNESEISPFLEEIVFNYNQNAPSDCIVFKLNGKFQQSDRTTATKYWINTNKKNQVIKSFSEPGIAHYSLTTDNNSDTKILTTSLIASPEVNHFASSGLVISTKLFHDSVSTATQIMSDPDSKTGKSPQISELKSKDSLALLAILSTHIPPAFMPLWEHNAEFEKYLNNLKTQGKLNLDTYEQINAKRQALMAKISNYVRLEFNKGTKADNIQLTDSPSCPIEEVINLTKPFFVLNQLDKLPIVPPTENSTFKSRLNKVLDKLNNIFLSDLEDKLLKLIQIDPETAIENLTKEDKYIILKDLTERLNSFLSEITPLYEEYETLNEELKKKDSLPLKKALTKEKATILQTLLEAVSEKILSELEIQTRELADPAKMEKNLNTFYSSLNEIPYDHLFQINLFYAKTQHSTDESVQKEITRFKTIIKGHLPENDNNHPRGTLYRQSILINRIIKDVKTIQQTEKGHPQTVSNMYKEFLQTLKTTRAVLNQKLYFLPLFEKQGAAKKEANYNYTKYRSETLSSIQNPIQGKLRSSEITVRKKIENILQAALSLKSTKDFKQNLRDISNIINEAEPNFILRLFNPYKAEAARYKTLKAQAFSIILFDAANKGEIDMKTLIMEMKLLSEMVAPEKLLQDFSKALDTIQGDNEDQFDSFSNSSAKLNNPAEDINTEPVGFSSDPANSTGNLNPELVDSSRSISISENNDLNTDLLSFKDKLTYRKGIYTEVATGKGHSKQARNNAKEKIKIIDETLKHDNTATAFLDYRKKMEENGFILDFEADKVAEAG